MYLGDDELITLKESLRRFHMKSAPLAASLRSNLLHRAPETLALLGLDSDSEPKELLQSLCAMVVIVEGNLESAGIVETFRQRAIVYRVQPEAYAEIAPALEQSMRQVFCNGLPDQYRVVWNAALAAVGGVIYDAAPTVDGPGKTQLATL